MLPREIYAPSPGRNMCQSCSVSYIDGGLTREDLWATETEGGDDAPRDHQKRISRDNGRTWSPFEAIEDQVNRQLPGGGLATSTWGGQFEPRLQVLYQLRLRRSWPGMPLYTYNWKNHEHPFHDHTTLIENGTVEKSLKYEEGPDFDPDNPFDPAYGDANRSYPGTSMAFAADGTVYYPVVCYRRGREYSFNRGGVVLMRRDPATGVWSPSTLQFIPPEWSSRGLLEPDVALLKNGNLLIVCRGSNTATTPGRKWMTFSTDGGRTLAPVQEFRYDDGSRFYSPSSIHRFFRSARNGVLYWLANICPSPPSGNGPRHPLYIAEIDEPRMAVLRSSLVLVDDRGKNEPERLCLSNFTVLEDRETLDVEIYMTRLGENAERFWETGTYRYRFSPPRGRGT
ncbi:MAG: exo-alpha-sialidase [Planctomycetes bacterium]|nr:exo-alpha-sialidase [Planctomycetota bacterium]